MPAPLLDPVRPPRRVLAICTRRLGDVLLTTPLLRSLRQAWPGAELDVLTLAWSASALEGNPDVSRVIPVDEGAGIGESLRAVGGLRRYDLALSTLPSDRAHLMAFCAGRRRAGLVVGGNAQGTRWKRALADAAVNIEGGRLHTVMQYLRLADALGIPRAVEVVPPRAAAQPAGLPAGDYVVLHPGAMHRYKGWPAENWSALARWIAAQDIRVVLDSGPATGERAMADGIAQAAALPPDRIVHLSGLRFPELTPLLERALAYVGPDTGITHLAAAARVPTVALFGPTPPLIWGPWPQGVAVDGISPWLPQAPVQHRGNVWILQGINPCVPCELEGCERHRDSRADCLTELPVSRVVSVLKSALLQGRQRRIPA